jgi:hypothetical protein
MMRVKCSRVPFKKVTKTFSREVDACFFRFHIVTTSHLMGVRHGVVHMLGVGFPAKQGTDSCSSCPHVLSEDQSG